MKSIRTFGIFICLTFSAFSLAHLPCNGIEEHISYGGPYCAETSSEAFAMRNLQLVLLRVQYPGDIINYRTIFSGEVNGQWCVVVQFVRCKNPKGANFKGSNLPSVVDKYASHLAEEGFSIEEVQVLKNGLIDVELVTEDGMRFFLTLDDLGNMVQMMEIK